MRKYKKWFTVVFKDGFSRDVLAYDVLEAEHVVGVWKQRKDGQSAVKDVVRKQGE